VLSAMNLFLTEFYPAFRIRFPFASFAFPVNTRFLEASIPAFFRFSDSELRNS
jgi:hypothetical protein